jgi:SAM-dependent methyltransferase
VGQIYDALGAGYANYRRADPRVATAIRHALSDACSVVNVGAGTGSYEPSDCRVLAVEPSLSMIRQRSRGRAPVVQASAVDLPFRDGAFAAAMAVLTVHHWPDRGHGLRELARVARERLVIVTWDPESAGFWLVDDYFPALMAFDRTLFPPVAEFEQHLGPIEVRALTIPRDCADGFLGAYWARPHAYLDPGVRGAISTFSRIGDVDGGLTRLRSDLEDGAWHRRHGHLLKRSELDLGYRLIVARGASASVAA